ncbi:MAG: acyltransferase [Corynebacterium sp.]|nr:acyltransferase [Corynebacterium sp.]
MHRHYIPALDTLRALSAAGILLTHASFLTGVGTRFFERFDFFVAVFFALSGFVLWRRYTPGSDWFAYYRSRFFRIVPAYVVVVLVTAVLLGQVAGLIPTLLFVQIYVSNALMAGLTHLWTMCVEVAFYLALPALRRLPAWSIVLLAVASLGWAWVPFAVDGVNAQLFPPAWFAWYAVGILTAEVEAARAASAVASTGNRTIRLIHGVGASMSLAAFVCAVLFLPSGFVHPTPIEFLLRVICGAVFAAGILVPWALWPPQLPAWSQAVGRWSYSLFLWHLPVLTVMFTLTGIRQFSGSVVDFAVITVLTLVVSVAVSYVSYSWVEQPLRRM